MAKESKLFRILEYLSNDEWFRPSASDEKIEVYNNKGEKYYYPKSYYTEIEGLGQILVRVSDHPTYLNTWIKASSDPTQSLQNLNIVISDKAENSVREIDKSTVLDDDGNEIEVYLYFVVEEYRYKLAQISFGDFTKIMKRLKNLGNTPSEQNRGVFTDPLKKKVERSAQRTVLTPTDKRGNDILPPKDPNAIHPRQISVAQNKDFEIDKDGNPIKEGRINNENREILKNKIRKIVKESISELINECNLRLS